MTKKLILSSGIILLTLGLFSIIIAFVASGNIIETAINLQIMSLFFAFILLSIAISIAGTLLLIEGARAE